MATTGYQHLYQNRWSGVWVRERYCAACVPGMFTAQDVARLTVSDMAYRAERLIPCADGTCGQCRAPLATADLPTLDDLVADATADLLGATLVKLECDAYGIVRRVAPFDAGHRDELGETFGPWRDARPWEAVHYESWPSAAVWTARYSDAAMADRARRSQP